MNADELKALQAPFKQKYKDQPSTGRCDFCGFFYGTLRLLWLYKVPVAAASALRHDCLIAPLGT